ncbi:MAG: vanadium-dependent haloperoxidase [Chitinophagaceae bacterium]|nr:vanadium-dependent haloperoxidase [Chitinophagaceae bacterium]
MRLFVAVAALSAMLVASCGNKDYKKVTSDPLLYSKTVKKLNDIVLENNFPPMIASRNYAYANIAAFECIVAGDSAYQSLSGQIKGLSPMPAPEKGKQIDFHLAAMLAFTKVGNAVTFPEGSMMAYYNELLEKADDAGMPGEVLENTKAFSDKIFAAVMDWSKKDNYAQTRSASKYTVTDEEGRWVPTPPSYTSALEAHWMEIRTLVMDSAGQCKPAAAPRFQLKDTSSQFYKAAMEVKTIGENLTEEEKHIADFWDDNPFKMNVSGHVMFATKKFSPGGHWMNIVGIASDKAGADFNTTVYAYAKTAIALFDGFISCWEEKYRSNVVRPETVINKYYDPEWRPYIQTPPFPSYTSGHSVISASAAEVMTDIFGDNFKYTDTSEIEFGIPHRSFTSFRQAAIEASYSRMYGGIHYRFDLEEGNRQGIQVGKMIVDRLRMRKKSEPVLTSK